MGAHPHPQRFAGAKWFALCVGLIASVALSDYLTGYELKLSILYLVPIFVSAWMLGRDAALMVSLIAAIAWLISTALTAYVYSHPFYHFWDAAINFVTFALFGLLIARLRVALLHADERFVTVLEGLGAPVWVEAGDGALLYSNERFHFEARRGSALAEATRGGNADAVPEQEVYDAATHRWYVVHSRALRWMDGRMVRLNMATDVTDRREAAELLRQQQERLQVTARLISVGELASTLAHELNQPLAAISNYIRGAVRRLQAGASDVKEIVAALEKADQQADRAGRIIQSARELVQRRNQSFGRCDLNTIVSRVVAIVSPVAEQHGVSIHVEADPRLPNVRADEVMIEQVMLNLSNNAIEAMAGAVPPRQLTLRCLPDAAGGVQVAVLDTGPGMDPVFERAPFTPFFTTKPGGMGLGLNICRSIIEAHGGHLQFERNQPTGCIFHFSVPRADA